MEAIGAASAIIGVAQFGLQFSQVLVTVIGDYRDAAKNINRLRDEIHLASICLQQLGDLASRDLLREYGILEATNLRERCQAVFWEVRSKIRKTDSPLHPTEIKKEQIDVTCFTSIKWALWTKKQLEEPRQELDRLKDSMTLCFISHMAILATNEKDKANYASQIPGIKRSLAWSEEKPNDDAFRKRLESAGVSQAQIAQILGEEVPMAGSQPSSLHPNQEPTTTVPDESEMPVLRAWSIDLLANTTEIPVSHEWIERFLAQNDMGDVAVWKTHSKLHPWFKNEAEKIFERMAADQICSWALVFLKPVYKTFISRKIPNSVQIVMRASVKNRSALYTRTSLAAEPVSYMMSEPMVLENHEEASFLPGGISPDSSTMPHVVIAQVEPRTGSIEESDEEMIRRQLALYQ